MRNLLFMLYRNIKLVHIYFTFQNYWPRDLMKQQCDTEHYDACNCHLLNHMVISISMPECTIAALCDLTKALDVIDHEIFIRKLNRYAKRGICK